MILFIPLLSVTLAAFYDYKDGKIYNWITYPLLISGILNLIINKCYSSLLITLVLAVLLILFSRMGGGDIKLLLGLYTYLGGINTLSLFITSIVLVGIVLIIKIPSYINLLKKDIISNFINNNSLKVPMGLAFAISYMLTIYNFDILQLFDLY